MNEAEYRASVMLDLVLNETILNNLDPDTTDGKMVAKIKTAVAESTTLRADLEALETQIREKVAKLQNNVSGVKAAIEFMYETAGPAFASVIDAEIAARNPPAP